MRTGRGSYGTFDKSRYVELKLCVLRETEKALLVFDPVKQDESQAVWVPISQTKTEGNISRIGAYNCLELELAEFIAKERGFI